MIRINVKTLVLIAMAISLCGSIHAQKMRKKTQLLYEKIISTYNWGKPWMNFDEYAMQKLTKLFYECSQDRVYSGLYDKGREESKKYFLEYCEQEFTHPGSCRFWSDSHYYKNWENPYFETEREKLHISFPEIQDLKSKQRFALFYSLKYWYISNFKDEFMETMTQKVDSAVSFLYKYEGNIDLGRREENRLKEIESNKLTFNVNGVSFDMMMVKAGTFTMGATPEMEDPYDNEKPAHQVTLTNNYYMGKTEVTQELWIAVMGNNKNISDEGNKKPIYNVNWPECQVFISKLNAITGKNFRLPTEAEWEFAARGGNNSRHYQYSGSNYLHAVAWCETDDGYCGGIHDVASKFPNELGIYDMSGNVWEWCSDRFVYYDSASQTNPRVAEGDYNYVSRGGNNCSESRDCRSSRRTHTYGLSYEGFRLALSE